MIRTINSTQDLNIFQFFAIYPHIISSIIPTLHKICEVYFSLNFKNLTSLSGKFLYSFKIFIFSSRPLISLSASARIFIFSAESAHVQDAFVAWYSVFHWAKVQEWTATHLLRSFGDIQGIFKFTTLLSNWTSGMLDRNWYAICIHAIFFDATEVDAFLLELLTNQLQKSIKSLFVES